MKSIAEAAKNKCELAFTLAIKNCIQPPKKGVKQRKVSISEADSQTLYAFYIKHIGGSREQALTAIGMASRRAAGKSALNPLIMFMLILLITLIYVFKSVWPALCALLICVTACYMYIKPRRTAMKIWASRKALTGKTEEALEKMCLLLASPLKALKLPVVGGLVGAAIVCLWQTIQLFI